MHRHTNDQKTGFTSANQQEHTETPRPRAVHLFPELIDGPNTKIEMFAPDLRDFNATNIQLFLGLFQGQ